MPLESAAGIGRLVARDEAEVRLDGLRAAQRAELAILEHPQEPRLEIGRHLRDFVQEERAARGLLDHPGKIVRARR